MCGRGEIGLRASLPKTFRVEGFTRGWKKSRAGSSPVVRTIFIRFSLYLGEATNKRAILSDYFLASKVPVIIMQTGQLLFCMKFHIFPVNCFMLIEAHLVS
ncbi:hypothetical protein ROLI_002800 [Roseobacter fucihabitans]|uniref:Uncharacterized protein n=1 Tax=Roseobacter fucihabitans TaxID=1537242 RepID=A0ABZ2BQN7_9RHOB|nr:hypothetical protein [Roseobacter litoralis]